MCECSTPKPKTRIRIAGTNRAEIAVSRIGFRVEFRGGPGLAAAGAVVGLGGEGAAREGAERVDERIRDLLHFRRWRTQHRRGGKRGNRTEKEKKKEVKQEETRRRKQKKKTKKKNGHTEKKTGQEEEEKKRKEREKTENGSVRAQRRRGAS
eukprot:1323559-Rhodomonas_salina.1